jgi:CRP-like cAMP-binding protein
MSILSTEETFDLRPPRFAPSANRLLAALPEEDYQRVVPHLTTVSTRFGQVLHKQGEPILDVYFPGGGACSLTKVMQDGETAEIATVGNEGILGSCVFFGDDQSPTETLVQVPDGDCRKMPRDAFMAEMERVGAFHNLVIRYAQALMTQVMQTTACNGLHTAEQRCCRWLLTTHDRVGSDELKLTHEFLSSMLGVRRPTVTLIAQTLQNTGLITYGRGHITIVNRQGLEAAACECYATVKANFQRLLRDVEPVGSR